MNFSEIINSITAFLSANLPEIIGTVFALIILAIFALLSDKIKEIYTKMRKKNTKPKEEKNKTLSDNGFLAYYVTGLIRRGSTLSFGDPASWSISGDESEGIITLDQIWTPLRVADSQTRKGKTGTHENMAEKDVGVDLRDLFLKTNEPLLILGDPGSGKSTSVAMLVVEAARRKQNDSDNLLPIWVNLASVKNLGESDPEQLVLSGVPEIEMTIVRFGPEAGSKLNNYLVEAINKGKALLILDGLDEVKENVLSKIRKAISHLSELKNGTRIVVTCRKFDYSQSKPNRKIPIERELELLPYSPEEQVLYIGRWYDAAVRIGRFSSTQANELKSALEQEIIQEGISELAETPLLLALLTLIHSEEAKLPDSRAVVCDRAITYMLADSAKWRVREAGSSTLASPPILALAVEIAYYIHKNENKKNRDDNREITVDLIEELANEICGNMEKAEPTKNPLNPNNLSQRFIKSHGLLLNSGNGKFKFAHRSFQEFLTGQYFSAGAHQEEALENCSSLHWREPFKLMASFAGHEGENLYYIFSLIDKLINQVGKKAVPSIQLGAEMLTEIGRTRIALHHFDKHLEKDGLWDISKSKMLSQVENPDLTVSQRERSANALGLLGDSRLISDNDTPMFYLNMVQISSGSSQIGTDRLDEELITRSGGFVGSPRKIKHETIRMGRYPITNIEFRKFIEDDGYENFYFWKSKLAKGWVSGDKNILNKLRDDWISKVYEHHAKEIRDGEIDTKNLEEESEKRTAPRKNPYYWFDRRFNKPNQPVVGINYWEVLAFCEWATNFGHKNSILDSDFIISIPTDLEWELMSRPIDDDRIYPWGDEWNEEKAHVSTNILNMRNPSPVGIYLESWKNGPCDLAGNVWEWTLSLHYPYSSEFDALRISNDSLEERVVKGSSWYNSNNVASCSVRCVDRSYNLFYDVGFRVMSIRKNQVRIGQK